MDGVDDGARGFPSSALEFLSNSYASYVNHLKADKIQTDNNIKSGGICSNHCGLSG
jgi:hypothetical protein